MNQKQAKQIRQDLRLWGVDWRQAEYVKVDRRGTIELSTKCGKAAYRRAKRTTCHDPL